MQDTLDLKIVFKISTMKRHNRSNERCPNKDSKNGSHECVVRDETITGVICVRGLSPHLETFFSFQLMLTKKKEKKSLNATIVCMHPICKDIPEIFARGQN